MRALGIALIVTSVLILILLWATQVEQLAGAFTNSYAVVLRSFVPLRAKSETSVIRRIARMGVSAPITLDGYRREQLRWLATGDVVAVLFILWLRPTPAGALVMLVVGAVAGVILRDRRLTQEVKRHEARIAANFPQVAELLALAVSAGESPVAALDRLSRRGAGPLIAEFESVINLMKAGVPLTIALDEMARRSGVTALQRFVDGVIVTMERGTPLAETLRMQAADVREAHRRSLLEASGRAEIAMMIPIVFLIMPITVLFALWPSLTVLSSMTY